MDTKECRRKVSFAMYSKATGCLWCSWCSCYGTESFCVLFHQWHSSEFKSLLNKIIGKINRISFHFVVNRINKINEIIFHAWINILLVMCDFGTMVEYACHLHICPDACIVIFLKPSQVDDAVGSFETALWRILTFVRVKVPWSNFRLPYQQNDLVSGYRYHGSYSLPRII